MDLTWFSLNVFLQMKNALERVTALQRELEREGDTRQQLEDAMTRMTQDRDALAAAVKRLQDEVGVWWKFVPLTLFLDI